MAFHAQFSLPLVHGSGSSLRRGVYVVGHKADLSVRDGSVNADELGTGSKYGAGRFNSGGSCGGSEEVLNTRLVEDLFFRMRLRCPNSGPSNPVCLIHLESEISDMFFQVDYP